MTWTRNTRPVLQMKEIKDIRRRSGELDEYLEHHPLYQGRLKEPEGRNMARLNYELDPQYEGRSGENSWAVDGEGGTVGLTCRLPSI